MDSLRKRIADFIRLPDTPEPAAARVVDRHLDDGYTRNLLRYSVRDGDQVDAFLFEPSGGPPRGGVLVVHQHNSQWAFGKSEIAGLVGDPLQAFGPALARRGMTVLAPDIIGFESRMGTADRDTSLAPALSKPASSPDGWLQDYNQMAHRLVQGDLLIRKSLSDLTAAFSLLSGLLPEGMPMGALGHSMGGGLTLFLGALDTRVTFTCSSGAVGSYRYKREHGIGLEMHLIIPGFGAQFEIADVLSCIAPRQVLVVSATEDPASGDAPDVVHKAQAACDAANVRTHLNHLHVHGGHGLDRRRFDAIVDWLVLRAQDAG